MKSAAVITATNLTIGYRTGKQENRVHENLSFQLFPGELTCLLGANGTGKSTLLRTLSATQPALSGDLLIGDRPLTSFTEKERSRTIGVVLTDKTQVGGLTVYELVALGRQPHTGFFGRLNKKDHAVIEEALLAVGISHKAQNYTAELSDGERQKAMIAKALVQECPLILLDEPTAFLDVVSRIEIMTLLHRLAATQKKAILLSTHDIEQALVLSDKLWLLSKEKGLLSGVTEDIILNYRMEELFKHPNIRFDYNHGVYYPQVTCEQQITVKAANEFLQHWSVNALNRHNYACLIEEKTTEHLPHLVVQSAQELYLSSGKVTHHYHSFEELLKELPQLLPTK
ncbi:MAG: ABC transporter ATP-binding protein [Phocaeicola sp.]